MVQVGNSQHIDGGTLLTLHKGTLTCGLKVLSRRPNKGAWLSREDVSAAAAEVLRHNLGEPATVSFSSYCTGWAEHVQRSAIYFLFQLSIYIDTQGTGYFGVRGSGCEWYGAGHKRCANRV